MHPFFSFIFRHQATLVSVRDTVKSRDLSVSIGWSGIRCKYKGRVRGLIVLVVIVVLSFGCVPVRDTDLDASSIGRRLVGND